jgi:hypothetical protein
LKRQQNLGNRKKNAECKASSFEEPGAGIPHAGICEGAVRQLAVLPRLLLHPDVLLLADSGYQGMHKHHQNSTLPVKKKKGQSLSAEDQAHNKALSKQRVFIEHVNRRCKIFRIVKDVPDYP